jgi:hypothetical protein
LTSPERTMLCKGMLDRWGLCGARMAVMGRREWMSAL